MIRGNEGRKEKTRLFRRTERFYSSLRPVLMEINKTVSKVEKSFSGTFENIEIV